MFDSAHYATSNPDVLNAVGRGDINNVFDHYVSFGESESRAPSSTYANFDSAGYLSANPDVAAAVTAGAFSSALDHFITFGQSESREGSGVTIVPVTGSTLTLTNGADVGASFQGTANGDTFDGSLNANGTQTLTTLDSLDGGAGVDSVTGVFNTAGTVAATLTNIENITVTSTAAVTLDLVNAKEVVSVTSTGTTAAFTINNIPSPATTITISNTGQNHTIDYLNSGVTGSADTATVNVANVTAGTLAMDNSIESLTISSGTSANTVAAITGDYDTLTIAGDSNLTITAADTDAETIDASGFSGGLTMTTNNTSATTVTGGAGNDAITAQGGTAILETISGGAGNDTITFTANLAATDVVNGGDGTDTLAGLSANLRALTSASTNISNFETVRVTDALGGDLTVANVQAGIDTVRIDTSAAGRTITFEAGSKAVDLRAAVGGALTVTDTGVATTDSLTITNNAAATDLFATNNLAVNGFETVTFNGSGSGNATSQDFGTITLATDTGGTDTINFTGSNAVTAGAITADVIDASGLTNLGLTMSANAVDATTITGSGAIDTLIADSNSGTAVSGGAGNDIITGGTGNDTLNGEEGNDSITVSTGSDIVAGGAGDDTINIAGGSLSSGDAITGGDGTDTLNFTAITAITAAAGQRISGFERLNLDEDDATVGDTTVNLASFINNSSFDRITIGDTDDSVITVSNVLDGFSDLRFSADAESDTEATLTRLVDTSTNAMTVTITGGETVKALTLDNEETLTITSSNSTAATITTLTSSDLATLNLTGSGNVVITNAIATATGLTTVDASGLIGAATVNGSASSTAITMTSGTGAATFTGGVASDTITGGASGDTLVGGAGADTITGGGGSDTITGGAGNDTLTGGGGADNFVLTSAGTSNLEIITDFAISTSGTNDIIQVDTSAFGAISDTEGDAQTASTVGIVEYDGNNALASNADGVSLIKATALTYNSSTDLLTDINATNITVDGGGTAADGENILATFYDVDGGFMSVGTITSNDSSGLFDDQVTYTENARVTMSSATYANFDTDNIDII